MDCRNPLIGIDLAALLNMGTNRPTDKKLAMQTGAFFQYIRIRLAFLNKRRSGNPQGLLLAPSAPNQEKSVFHQAASLGGIRLLPTVRQREPNPPELFCFSLAYLNRFWKGFP